MTRRTRSFVPSWATVAFAVLVTIAGCGREHPSSSTPSASPARIRIRVALNKYLSNAPLMIAYDRGYFRDEGLDVEIAPGGNDYVLGPALASGRIDVEPMILSPTFLNMILRGAKIRIVADKGFLDPNGCTANALVARSSLVDSGDLDRPGGLKGRSVGYERYGEYEYLLEKVAQQHGDALTDIVRASSSQYTTVEALQNGVDIRFAAEPMLTRVLATKAGKVWLPLQKVEPGASIAFIMYGPKMLENPDIGARFMRAYLRGVADARRGPTDQNVAIAEKYTGLGADLLRKACWTPLKADGSVDLAALDDFARWAWQKHYIDGPIDHTKIWDGRFIEAAREKR